MSDSGDDITAAEDDELQSSSDTKSTRVSILNRLQSFRCNTKLNCNVSRLVATRTRPLQKTQDADVPNIHKEEGKMLPDAMNRGADEISSLMKMEEDQNSSILDKKNLDPEDGVTIVPESDDEEGLSVLCAENLKKEVDTKTPKENVIRRIDRGVVHQICSGQVIVTLCTAVKELVENSLDAGSTQIDIRLVEHGSKLIEVSDNGSGIDEINFEGLVLKHHTSKITEFEDLGNITTFGFRGEALSSLCALSTLTVITRSKDSDQKVGYKIDYDNNGRIVSKSRCAREFGTTVVMKDLFHTLPVRHREFLKNLKREFHKMTNVLYGYCLIVDGVRISCTNQVGNAAPSSILGVPAFKSMKERIVGLFGSKQLSLLLEVKRCESIPEEILTEYGLTEKTYERKYDLEGFISHPNHGRSSSDRQFFFINSRPCDPTKITRLINEVYHQRGVCNSRQQSPFICLHIKTPHENVDINVTPDKRTLYVQNENILLATLKATLTPILTDAASSYIPAGVSSFTQLELLQFRSGGNTSKLNNENTLSLSSSFHSEVDMEEGEGTPLSSTGFDRQYSSSSAGIGRVRSTIDRTNAFDKSISTRSDSSITFGCRKKAPASSFSSSGYKRIRNSDSEDSPLLDTDDNSKLPKLFSSLQRFEAVDKIRYGESGLEQIKNISSSNPVTDSESTQDSKFGDSVFNFNREDNSSDDSDVKVVYDDEIESESELAELRRMRKSVVISVDWRRISAELISAKKKEEKNATSVNYARRFRAKIAPEDNNVAEEELKKQLTKEMFGKMEILGQFNLGFIIVRNGPDLFIVDQHASDEKYNYEDLEKTTVLQGQQLIHPLELQLPAISENIIIDNISVFQKNGFDFIITPDDAPTKRVKLSKIPYSKNTEFGKSDIEELIFMLEDVSEKSFFRPTRVRDMLASRACRKSVMIGTALSTRELRGIVDHMGEMNHPWNCPHGRPTIRHLINLNLLPDLDLNKFNH